MRRGWLDRRAGARLRPLLALAALLLVLVPGTPAWAHNALAEASPAKNATLKKPPTEVKLRFLQKLDPKYTTITVSDAAKAPVPTSAPKVTGNTGAVTFDAPPANGVYTVAYQVVSTDGHTVKGSYEFTVDDPSATAAPSAVAAPDASILPTSAAPAPTAPVAVASTESTTLSIPALLAGIVAVLAVAAGLVLLFIRRRKA